MAAAKGTSTAKAKRAPAAASDTTQENGASAPSSLDSGVVGELPAGGAAGVEGKTTGGGDDNANEKGEGVDAASGTNAPMGGGDGAVGDVGSAVPGDGAAGDQGPSDSAGGAAAGSGSAADLPGAADSRGLDDGASLTGADAAQAVAQALSAGGVGDALLALLDTAKTEQTPSENGPAEPVISTVWAMPEIGTFPAHISLQNNTPSRVTLMRVRLEPYSSTEGSIGEEGYAQLSKTLARHARLGKWDNLLGVQVKHDSND